MWKKVGWQSSEWPPPTLGRVEEGERTKKNKTRLRSPWIRRILPSTFLLQSHKHRGTRTNMKRRGASPSRSLHVQPPPPPPRPLPCRERGAREIWPSAVRLTGILDKANPNLYAAWQAGTWSNANARDTLEIVALCGYFYKPLRLPWNPCVQEQFWGEPAGGSVCTCFINHSPLFLSLLLFSASALSSCYSLKRLGIISPQETGNM